jgi:hypothetical protein
MMGAEGPLAVTSPIPEFDATRLPKWWVVHSMLLQAWPECQSDYTDRTWSLLSRHQSVKIRLQYSASLLTELVLCRKQPAMGDVTRRDFEGWLFFAKSALDCEAGFVNELLELGVEERLVNISWVAAGLDSTKWPELRAATVLEIGDGNTATWFRHFNGLRRMATHREVVGTGSFLYIGEQGPDFPDDTFVSPDPSYPRVFRHEEKWGAGTYVQRHQQYVERTVEAMETALGFYIAQGRVTIS